MKLHRVLKIFAPLCLAVICLIIWVNSQSPDFKRSKFCRTTKPLTEIQANNYDNLGIYWHSGTFTRKVFLDGKGEIKVIIFPRGLSPQNWSKISSSSIQYIGKGGDDSWQEWLRPDYFYVLEVPKQATALAFGRLCYRNGDVEVESIKKLTPTSLGKISINNKIYLSHLYPLPKINSSTVIVNTGSNRLDTLGIQTEVYFTTVDLPTEN
ncbi:hypothetical protein IQ244_30090 [Nostoc sp. LEGE 06077]|uniref:hypothetical protein n=1 Tax=Nostoc sp. LEGE 06077 TaxID=915325 RepID=UPI0018818E85|nr:hypothetical protein [Nostoc sp. LEGE 06077]MBE9210680.1 hypothetical protein [Nostoc sp. LEGE 06077]